MASMSYCLAQNAKADIMEIKDKIRNGKNFSKLEQSALATLLEISLQIIEELGVEIEMVGDKSIQDAITEYCEEYAEKE